MVNIDPYLTSYGRLINIENLKKELLKYVITNDSNLNYEYATEDQSKLVFITGYNSEEKELPLFEHPIIIKDMKNNRGDLYLEIQIQNPSNLTEKQIELYEELRKTI